MEWLPINITLRDRCCLIVGGGEVAARKCQLLLHTGVRITIVALQLCTELLERERRQEINYRCGTFIEHKTLMEGMTLVVAATNKSEVNREIALEAKRYNILVNVVDDASLSTFIFPAIIDRDPVTVAVSSSGTSPYLARVIKSKIETMLPAQIGSFARVLVRLKTLVKEVMPLRGERQAFMEQIINAYLEDEMSAYQEDTLFEALKTRLSQWRVGSRAQAGKVFIVGAGPGNPDFLTLKAYRLLQNCDVVLYDHLVDTQILEYCRRDAIKLLVGRRSGSHCDAQQYINEQFLFYAKQDRKIIRLKSGDPAMFARLGEEGKFLQKNAIPYEVIPGITAAMGCAASLKIPLTYRKIASSCLFVTAHNCDDNSIDWKSMVATGRTLLFYMGVKAIQQISENLMANGMPGSTPMVLVVDCSRRLEQRWDGTVETLPNRVADERIEGPGIIIVGEVLRLMDES